MGVYSKLNRPIVVVEYDPQWPGMFEHEKEAIMAALGNWVLLIEHIGSTAVPGLAAKPVIDIGVGIRSLMDAHDLIPRNESLEYIYEATLELLVPERRFFWKGTPTIHTCHLHLAEPDHPVLLKPLQFRDYLRKHPPDGRPLSSAAGPRTRIRRKQKGRRQPPFLTQHPQGRGRGGIRAPLSASYAPVHAAQRIPGPATAAR